MKKTEILFKKLYWSAILRLNAELIAITLSLIAIENMILIHAYDRGDWQQHSLGVFGVSLFLFFCLISLQRRFVRNNRLFKKLLAGNISNSDLKDLISGTSKNAALRALAVNNKCCVKQVMDFCKFHKKGNVRAEMLGNINKEYSKSLQILNDCIKNMEK